ncbi:hypothetical protein TIFTF001_035473, partial [Ficus carica]
LFLSPPRGIDRPNCDTIDRLFLYTFGRNQ